MGERYPWIRADGTFDRAAWEAAGCPPAPRNLFEPHELCGQPLSPGSSLTCKSMKGHSGVCWVNWQF